MKRLFLVIACLGVWFLPGFAEDDDMTPQQAFNILMEGNSRYVTDQLLHPQRTLERRLETVSRQKPFAVVVGCSDSRVSPEIVFDQGIGDIFVVRVAGNVIGPLEMDSIEYAILHLNSIVVLVLGHEKCGAVKAVLKGMTKDIEAVARLIEPAVARVKKSGSDNLTDCIKENVKNMVDVLKKSPVVADYIKRGAVDVYGGYYQLGSGKVTTVK